MFDITSITSDYDPSLVR